MWTAVFEYNKKYWGSVIQDLNKTLYFFSYKSSFRFKGTQYVPHDVLDIYLGLEICFICKIMVIIFCKGLIKVCLEKKSICAFGIWLYNLIWRMTNDALFCFDNSYINTRYLLPMIFGLTQRTHYLTSHIICPC